MDSIIHKMGWKPDLPDHRDQLCSLPVQAALPSSIDLRSMCPIVYDQQSLGSCTAQAIAALAQFLMVKQGYAKPFVPSRLFIYYNERVLEGTVNYDSGASIRSGMKVAAAYLPHEAYWWYNIKKFTVKPNKGVYADGLKTKMVSYQSLNNTNITQLKSCLASGFPFVFGFSVYESFGSQVVANTGVAPMPGPGERLLGGHACMAVGFNDATQRFLVRNSWSAQWGQGGYFTIPYQYVCNLNLAADFWMAHNIVFA